MGAISDATEMQHSAPNGLDFSLMNCSNSEKSIATDMATMGTVDSNNNIKQEESEQTEQMSFQAKKDLFQSKSSSPNLCRTRSESGISPPPFERSNSLPGLSSSQPSQQLSLMQPHFASSSFYDPRSHPTIEEQVSGSIGEYNYRPITVFRHCWPVGEPKWACLHAHIYSIRCCCHLWRLGYRPVTYNHSITIVAQADSHSGN